MDLGYVLESRSDILETVRTPFPLSCKEKHNGANCNIQNMQAYTKTKGAVWFRLLQKDKRS